MKNQIQVLKQTELCGQQFTVYGTADNPLFKATDIATIIEHSNARVMLQSIDDDEKGVRNVYTPGGCQQGWFLTEDGLYEVLMQSRKPIAKQFKKGIKTILKEIRKTGGYIASRPDETPEEIMARALLVAKATIERSTQRIQMLEGENTQLSAENRRLAPKAAYADSVLQSTSTYTFTQMAKELGFRSVNAFLDVARERRMVFRQSGQWLLTARYAGKGYTATRTARFFRTDGTPDSSVSTVWTEKGRAFLHEMLDSVSARKGGAL